MHRTARILKLLGSALVVGFLAASCTVTSDNGDEDDVCSPGSSAPCTCPNGNASTKLCNATGSAYAACSCSTASGGSGNSGGSVNTAGEGGAAVSTGGADSSGGAGGDTGTGGDPGTGGTGDGGMSQGGEGGGGPTEPLTCDACIATPCMGQLTACENNAECPDELACLTLCMEEERALLTAGMRLSNDAITVNCMTDCGFNDGWPGGIDQTTMNVLDCMAGKMDWDTTDPPHWGESPCADACFGPLP